MEMKKAVTVTLLGVLSLNVSAFADSKRVEVYPLSQHYWDTKRGETLSGIAAQLLPNNPAMQIKLMNSIISQNPNAFHNNDPDEMRANIRLWLPNRLTQTDSKVDPKQTQVKSFSWGNIKRPKR